MHVRTGGGGRVRMYITMLVRSGEGGLRMYVCMLLVTLVGMYVRT